MRKILTATVAAIVIASTSANAATFNDVVWRKHAGGYQLACITITIRHGTVMREMFTTPWLATFATKAETDRAARNIDCK